jgi:hypothetical protein
MGVTAVTEPLVRETRRGSASTAATGTSSPTCSAPEPARLRSAGRVRGRALRRRDKLREAVGKPRAPSRRPERRSTASTRKVAETFAEVVPEEQRTPDEQAAIHAIQRDAEVKATRRSCRARRATTPTRALDRGMARSAARRKRRAAPVKPVARETIAAPDDVAGTRFPARELLKAKIHAVEARTAAPTSPAEARSGPISSSRGRGSACSSAAIPNDTRSFDEIAALREDPHLNDVLINDLISENAAALRHAGFEESAGNLYLAHVLGHDRAVTVLRADPNARLGDLLPAGLFQGQSVQADRQRGEPGPLGLWQDGRQGGCRSYRRRPDAAAGREAIAAARRPTSRRPTGRFDVEALYGDVGMTDRPVSTPSCSAAPRSMRRRRCGSSAKPTCRRRLRAGDEPRRGVQRRTSISTRSALSRHVTPRRSAKRLGFPRRGPPRRRLDAGERPNSPFVLTRGRAPKRQDGQRHARGHRAGRVIRRPPRRSSPMRRCSNI